MITESGEKVQVIDDEDQPSEELIDKKTGKRIPRKKKIINEDGEIEDVEEIIEDIPTEYDEETGKKKPKHKKGKDNDSEDEEKDKKKSKGQKKKKRKRKKIIKLKEPLKKLRKRKDKKKQKRKGKKKENKIKN